MQILPHKNYETPRSPDSTNTSQRSMRILMEGGEGHLLVHQMFVSYLQLTCLWNRRTSLFVLTYYKSKNLDLLSHEYWNKLSLRILSAKTILPWLRIHSSLKFTLLRRAYGTSFYPTLHPSPNTIFAWLKHMIANVWYQEEPNYLVSYESTLHCVIGGEVVLEFEYDYANCRHVTHYWWLAFRQPVLHYCVDYSMNYSDSYVNILLFVLQVIICGRNRTHLLDTPE